MVSLFESAPTLDVADVLGEGDAPSGPLSWFQERLWVHHERDPRSTGYNLPVLLDITGDLDAHALERSLDLVVARHETLRTTYDTSPTGETVQHVQPHRPLALPVVPVDRAGMLAHLDRLLEHRFDLRTGPPLVAHLLRVADRRHLLLLNVHHIAADAWSLQAILPAELQTAYAAFCRGERPALPALTAPYRDHARRQRAPEPAAHLEYWRSTLAGYEDGLELPTRRPRPRTAGRTTGTFVHRYPPALAAGLDRFSRAHGSTLFMTLLAGLGVTLARYTGRDDLCVGTTSSDRPQVELEPLIGFFVNIVPLRLRVDEHAPVADLLQTVRARVLDAFEHPVPFERVLQVTDAARRGSANPLVPVIVRHQNFPRTALDAPLPGGVTFDTFPGPDPDDDVAAVLERPDVPARCEIELSYAGDRDGLAVEVAYASDVYDRAEVERLLDHHQRVLEGMLADPAGRVRDLPLLGEQELADLLARGAGPAVDPAPRRSFVELFDDRVARDADAVAVHDGTGTWTYGELARRTRHVAHALATRGVGPGDLVGVCVPRGGDLIATLLGVWRTGAAYVPLDPAYPPAYLRQILDDAAPRVVVGDVAHQRALGVPDDAWLVATGERGGDEPPAVALPAQPAPPDGLAYVMYTSGSTGRPKGVRVPHRQLDAWCRALVARVPFAPGEVVAQKTTSAFAVGVKEMFAGLLHGCPQVVVDAGTVRDTAAFVDALAAHRVTRVNLVPSHLAGVLEHLADTGGTLPDLRLCITAGEPLPRSLVVAFRAALPGARLLNNYGCTELNDVTYHDTGDDDLTGAGSTDFVPIGRPIAGTHVYVLDRLGRPVPAGVPGELHVASVGLPPGYHGLDALTAERFVPHPFGAPGERVYNTGDVVRFLPDGALDFVGRWDLQVKVRGARIEVRQVEDVIGQVAGVRARAVVGTGDRLVAYYTTHAERPVPVSALREHLEQRLPAHLVPDAFVPLDALPVLPNGKLDRRALAGGPHGSPNGLPHGLPGGAAVERPHEEPATATERMLAEIWGVVVNVPAARIGRGTHFFEIGGHSLSAMRVLARVRDACGVRLGLAEVFDAPRLEALAAAIDRQRARTSAADAEAAPSTTRSPRASGSGLLQDKVVLITGGSRGIGLSTARLLASHGAQVAINYRDSEAQARRVQQLIADEGGTADVFAADVTQADDVARMVAAVDERFGRVDVLVANAHMHFRHRPFLEYDWDDLERKVNDELRAVFHVSRAVAPQMVRRRSGSIIAVSSTLSKRSTEGFLAQSTAKAAVDAFVRSLAAELGQHGVRVNTVAPGLTLTDAAMPMAPHVKEDVASRSPMRRNGVPEDMAGAVAFLASDLSRFMTGTYLPVDGGFTTL